MQIQNFRMTEVSCSLLVVDHGSLFMCFWPLGAKPSPQGLGNLSSLARSTKKVIYLWSEQCYSDVIGQCNIIILTARYQRKPENWITCKLFLYSIDFFDTFWDTACQLMYCFSQVLLFPSIQLIEKRLSFKNLISKLPNSRMRDTGLVLHAKCVIMHANV